MIIKTKLYDYPERTHIACDVCSEIGRDITRMSYYRLGVVDAHVCRECMEVMTSNEIDKKLVSNLAKEEPVWGNLKRNGG